MAQKTQASKLRGLYAFYVDCTIEIWPRWLLNASPKFSLYEFVCIRLCFIGTDLVQVSPELLLLPFLFWKLDIGFIFCGRHGLLLHCCEVFDAGTFFPWD